MVQTFRICLVCLILLTSISVDAVISRLVISLPGERFISASGNSGAPATQYVGTTFYIRIAATNDTLTTETSYTGDKTLSYTVLNGTISYTYSTVNFSSGLAWDIPVTLNTAGTTTITIKEGTNYGYASSQVTVIEQLAQSINTSLIGNYVIGQPDFVSNTYNQGRGGRVDGSNYGAPDGDTLYYPRGCFIRNGKIYVADSYNNRVLIFNSLPAKNKVSADVVLGHPDMLTTGYSSSSYRYYYVYDACVDDNRIFVCSYSYDRVNIYNTLNPLKSVLTRSETITSNVILGRASFSGVEQGTSANRFNYPYGVHSDGIKLFVADFNNNRVLIWNTIPTVSATPADVVVGAPDMNTPDSGTTSRDLKTPTGVFSDGTRLFVADYGNHRVLIWNKIPTSNYTPADIVIGQNDFGTGSSNRGNQNNTPASNTLYNPTRVFWADNKLFIADYNNHRVLGYYCPSGFTQEDAESGAVYVFGQPTYGTSIINRGNGANFATADGLYNPWGVSYDTSTNRVLIADTYNHRVVITGIFVSVSAPYSLSAKIFENGIKLTWSASTKGDLDFWYDIYRSTSTNGTYSKINSSEITTTTYLDSDVSKGGTYYYKIYAVDGFRNTSSASNTASSGFVENAAVIFANKEGELTALDDTKTKIKIDANTISRDVKFKITRTLNVPTGAKEPKFAITAYDIFAEEYLTETAINNFDNSITIIIHCTASGGYVDNTNSKVTVSDAKNKLAIAYWTGINWQITGGDVNVDSNNTDITITAKTKHLSTFGIIVKDSQMPVSIFPNPFTPDGPDSKFKTANFTFDNTNGEVAELKVYDMAGILVRTLTNENGLSLISWDGKDEEGNTVEGGAYLYQLKLGNTQLAKGVVVIAK